MNGVFSVAPVHRIYTSKTQAICYIYYLKGMVFRKLRNLISRQAQEAASKDTAKTQPWSDGKQPEPVLVCRPRSSPTVVGADQRLSPTKATGEKGKFLKLKEMRLPSLVLLAKVVKGEEKIPKFKTIIMNYFDKHLKRIDKNLQQQSNKNAEMENIFKFKHKETRCTLNLAKKFYKLFKIFDQQWIMMTAEKPTAFLITGQQN